MILADIDPTTGGNTRQPPRQSQKISFPLGPCICIFLYLFVWCLCASSPFNVAALRAARLHFFFFSCSDGDPYRAAGAESRCRNRRISLWSVDLENTLGKPPSTQYTARMNISFHRRCADRVRGRHKKREMNYSVLNLGFGLCLGSVQNTPFLPAAFAAPI